MYNKKQLSMIFPKRRGRWCAFSFFYQLRCNLQRHLFFLSVLDFRGRRRRIRAYSQTLYRLTLRTFRAPAVRPGFGRQINAHCDGVGELGTCKTHCPFAEAPLYASAGQGIFDPHFGEQKLCVLCERESIYERAFYESRILLKVTCSSSAKNEKEKEKRDLILESL